MIGVGIIRERILAYQRMTYLNIGKSALSLIPAVTAIMQLQSGVLMDVVSWPRRVHGNHPIQDRGGPYAGISRMKSLSGTWHITYKGIIPKIETARGCNH